MRPLPHMRETKRILKKELPVRFSGALAAVLLAMGAWTLGCGGGGAGSGSAPAATTSSSLHYRQRHARFWNSVAG
jgi:hypothetical protein